MRTTKSQNKKMIGSPIVMCPEIERADPCTYFGKGFCPNCYAENLWPKRNRSWKGKMKTPPTGIIRLGTWREIMPEDYRQFKDLFPDRKFFIITRGLLTIDFYRKLNDDSMCLNIQVSVDRIDGSWIPVIEKLQDFKQLSKVMFRFKTTPKNAEAFYQLYMELGISSKRILETPLRLRNGQKLYMVRTPLMKYLGKGLFYRCNTECKDCSKENRYIVCVKKADFNIC